MYLLNCCTDVSQSRYSFFSADQHNRVRKLVASVNTLMNAICACGSRLAHLGGMLKRMHNRRLWWQTLRSCAFSDWSLSVVGWTVGLHIIKCSSRRASTWSPVPGLVKGLRPWQLSVIG